jgi:AbrB family looped-hinge helix DNA binding protein
MRITERGQVTIPKPIREQFGLTSESEVDFVVRDGRLELVRHRGRRRSRIDEIYGRKRLGRSTDELMKLLRG